VRVRLTPNRRASLVVRATAPPARGMRTGQATKAATMRTIPAARSRLMRAARR
jgi:hypothetical protein